VTTIEAVAHDGELSALQQALHEVHGLQCGFCTPGIVMTFEAYLRDHPAPTDREIREVLSGNLCRCTGYHNIVRAVRKVVLAGAPAGGGPGDGGAEAGDGLPSPAAPGGLR
jgi:carbon-monoxide dehydrogenase small subunit